MSATRIEVIMPQMGEAITEATIMAWRKSVGDSIEEGETLLEISTAKVEVEIPAPASGVLSAILHKEGDTVPVDQIIALMLPPGSALDEIELNAAAEQAKAAPQPAPVAPAPTAAVVEIPVEKGKPRNGSSAPRKATPEPVSPVIAAEGANGSREGKQDDDSDAERERLIKRRSSPLVRSMARQLGIDITGIEGSGVHGRVTRRDLENFIASQKTLNDLAAKAEGSVATPRRMNPDPEVPPGALRLDTVSGPSDEPIILPPEEVAVSAMRRQIADQMVKSIINIPQAFTVHEVDFTQLERLRMRYRPTFESKFSARLTPLVFLIRAVTEALLQCPHINASWGGDRVILHRNVNIGLAVAIEGGLVVPVLKCVETQSLAGIARGIAELARRARSNRLKPSDMEGATFTITSPGQLGAEFAIPIVNRPQGGILHFAAIKKVPAVVTGPDGEDTIAIRQRAKLTLGIDHRLIDGWEADQFMVLVKSRIQKAEFNLPL